MSESAQNAAHVTLKRSFDTSELSNVRAAASAEGIDLSFTDLIVRAVGAGLAAHPEFNALYEDETHKIVEEVNIGVAVDVEDGLLTPVVPTVASRSVESVAEVRGELTERALSGEFSMDDLSGGTFTITNLGMFGIDSFDPIINPPEVGILGVGRIRDDGTMTLSLSFDHRVVNGADAARFLDTIVTHLTDPVALLDLFETDLFERYALEN
jgi:pyruvate dehydrogenase E2 component (dihydrolipoamide acetyltransferase)